MVSTRGSRAPIGPRVAASTPSRPIGLSSARACACAAAALVVAFVAVTAWWLSVDASTPYNDAADHLLSAMFFHDEIQRGELLHALRDQSFYPPATYLLGAISMFVGGVTVAAPILGQNLVYVPLLAIACYQLGKLLEGPLAGLMAVAFALGAPLVIEQFHVFMLDIPQATLVAVSTWLIVASRRFARVGVAALAGLALGVGVASKELAPFYLIGLVVCVLARGGGWRNWRGLLAFGAAALLVGAPWYLEQLQLGHADRIFEAAGEGRDVPPTASPPLLSATNLAWYLWATLNGLLFAPLFLFAAVGVGAAVARVRRMRDEHDFTLELLCGLAGAWAVLTVIPHHDMRYTLGLVVFLAVLGTVWIVRLAGAPRLLATSLLVAAVLAAHAGATLGIGGGDDPRRLPGSRIAINGEGVPPRDTVIVYANENFMVSRPRAEPDVLALFSWLRQHEMTAIAWEDQVEAWYEPFDPIGLRTFARIARIGTLPEGLPTSGLRQGQAYLIRAHEESGGREPCVRFADGTGAWVRVGLGPGRTWERYCPAALRERVS